MKEWNKETVYDEQISPLMLRIIAICKEHQIPMVAQFQYADGGEDGPGYCTTALAFEGVASERLANIARNLRPPRPVAIAETIETLPDGSTRITSRLV